MDSFKYQSYSVLSLKNFVVKIERGLENSSHKYKIPETLQDTEANRTIFNSVLESRKPIDLSSLPEVKFSNK